MQRLPMLPLKRCAAILLCAASVACATPARPPIAPDASCIAFRAISYAQLAAGVVDDLGNGADSAATVAEIEAHNARYDALCLRPGGAGS